MSYVSEINGLIREKVAATSRLVCFGQNITAGSCLGGFSRGLKAGPDSLVINTPNSENTLVGTGFGLMLGGASGIYFMKQLDFLLLGIDHLVNTYNVVRQRNLRTSFTIAAVVVDSGFEGPQSCFNALSDICSMANLPGYAISSAAEARFVIGTQLVAPGCRIVAVSQRLFGTDIIDIPAEEFPEAPGIFRYARGTHATVCAFNFALPQALALCREAEGQGKSLSLFGIPAQATTSCEPIFADLRRTGNLVVVDDSRSANKASDRFLAAALQTCPGIRVTACQRRFDPAQLRPNPDDYSPDLGALCAAL